jgi:hypothetical protein
MRRILLEQLLELERFPNSPAISVATGADADRRPVPR